MMANDLLNPVNLTDTRRLDVGVDNLLGFLETGTLRVYLTGADAAKFKLYLFNYSPDPQNPTLDAAGPSGYVDVPTVMPGASRYNCFRIAPVSSVITVPGVPETWTALVNVNSLARDLSMSFFVTLTLDDPMRNQDFTLNWYGDEALVWDGPTAGMDGYRVRCTHSALGSPAAITYFTVDSATGQVEEAPPWTSGALYGVSGGDFVFQGNPWPLTGDLTVQARLEYPLPAGGSEYLSGYCVIRPDRTQGASQ
jgi:hypothetical protein